MPTEKELKQEFKLKASQQPDKYYATGVLKSEGFRRQKCAKCGMFFWSTTRSPVCGDPACSGGFRFFDRNPTKENLDYLGVWKRFAELFKKWGYTPIKRYPVTARWREDVHFVQASIYDFQPYVVSGEVQPPANPLVVPQFCLRFNDIDNVGITGAHYTGFVMIGQHAFMPPEKWDQQKYFTDIYNWLRQGMKFPKEEITFHEDAWAGGGNIGPSMEFFVRGLELGNQVYMTHRIEDAESGTLKELNLKVLDMGMGHERHSWISQATSNSYESTFPTVCKKLYAATGLKVDQKLVRKFLPYASYLNIDEVEDVNKAWQQVAEKVGVDAQELRQAIQPLAAMYSIGEHARSLLAAITDGSLPSNVGGGYNLRVILRRALGFIEHYRWNIYLPDVCAWHARYLKPLFPELNEHLESVQKILDVEKMKYDAARQKTKEIVVKILNEQKEISERKLIELYDSNGIAPELVEEEAKKIGKKIAVPENFYARIAEVHEEEQRKSLVKKEKKEVPLEALQDVPETKALYYDDWKKVEFAGKVLKMISDRYVLLDQTCFYPTSGGQEHDTGALVGAEGTNTVVDVIKQGKWIIHALGEKAKIKAGEIATGKIDFARRKQHAQHHTGAHILNAAARRVLGEHINQAGARKTVEKGTLDITHYAALSEEEVEQIEEEANNIIRAKMPHESRFVPRTKAEQEYGMRIYQGGVVPGALLRIVEIPGIEAEACGGTHLKNTGEAELIRIISTSKIQDGIVRIEYKAGAAAYAWEKKLEQLKEKIKELAKREFAVEIITGESSLKKAQDVFHVTLEQLYETIQKFILQIKDYGRSAGKKKKFEEKLPLEEFCRQLFDCWKELRSEAEKARGQRAAEQAVKIKENAAVFDLDLELKAMITLSASAKHVLLVNKQGQFVFKGPDTVFKKLLASGAKGGGGEVKQGMLVNVEKVRKEKWF